MKNILKKLRHKRAQLAKRRVCDHMDSQHAHKNLDLIRALDKKISRLEAQQ